MEPKVKKPAAPKRYIWICELHSGEVYSSVTHTEGQNWFSTAAQARENAKDVIVDEIGEEFTDAQLYILDVISGERFDVNEQPAYKYDSRGELR